MEVAALLKKPPVNAAALYKQEAMNRINLLNKNDKEKV